MKHTRGKTLLIVYGLPLLLGSAARIVFFINWLDSPLTKYHEVPGLDMKLLVFYSKAFYQHGGFISLNKLLTALTMCVNGGSFSLEYLIFVQLLFGLGTSLLTAAICLKFFGKRWAACIAGCLAALYSPALMYEGLALRETLILFVCSLSLYFVLKAKRRRFKGFWLPLSAVFVFLPSLERISLFCYAALFSSWILFYMTRLYIKNKRPGIKQAFLYFIKISSIYTFFALIVISPLIIYAYKNSDHYMNYITLYFERAKNFENNSSEQYKEVLKPAKETRKPSTGKYGKYEKAIALLKAHEVTNNVNYYFLKNQIFPLKYLIGPLLLLPMALAGLALMLIQGKLFKKEFFLFAFLVSFILPVCFYMPLARYRLGILPIFCVSAVYLLIFIARELKIANKNNLKILLVAVLYILILYWETPKNIPIRAEDFLAYGIAMEKRNGDSQDVENCFRMAYFINPESKSAVVNLSSKLLEHGKLHDAMKVLGPAFKTNPEDSKIAVNYAALLNRIGAAGEAEKILRNIHPAKGPRSKTIYYFQLAESLRLQGKREAAENAYAEADKTADKNQLKAIAVMRRANSEAEKKKKK